jgi:hypothetical protein
LGARAESALAAFRKLIYDLRDDTAGKPIDGVLETLFDKERLQAHARDGQDGRRRGAHCQRQRIDQCRGGSGGTR